MFSKRFDQMIYVSLAIGTNELPQSYYIRSGICFILHSITLQFFYWCCKYALN